MLLNVCQKRSISKGLACFSRRKSSTAFKPGIGIHLNLLPHKCEEIFIDRERRSLFTHDFTAPALRIPAKIPRPSSMGCRRAALWPNSPQQHSTTVQRTFCLSPRRDIIYEPMQKGGTLINYTRWHADADCTFIYMCLFLIGARLQVARLGGFFTSFSRLMPCQK
jgi:hypothetical protein